MIATTATQLPVSTRVLVEYKGEEHQGSVREGSTERFAKVEVLGRADRPKITVPWSALTKVEYRCFKVVETPSQIIITEVEPKNSHWMNWMGFGEMSREGAWAFAGARGKQVLFVGRMNDRRDLGRVFNPAAFERAAYQGYTSYGYSMSDGYYAPEKFESWVIGFRKDPAGHLANQNDAAESVKAALPLYQQALAAR
jgi:hypothetical protein